MLGIKLAVLVDELANLIDCGGRLDIAECLSGGAAGGHFQFGGADAVGEDRFGMAIAEARERNGGIGGDKGFFRLQRRLPVGLFGAGAVEQIVEGAMTPAMGGRLFIVGGGDGQDPAFISKHGERFGRGGVGGFRFSVIRRFIGFGGFGFCGAVGFGCG